MTTALVTGDPKYADRDAVVYDAPCPACGHRLEWLIETPPIPMTLFSWLDPDGEGQRIQECPSCDEVLPDGDLTKEETP